MALTFLLSITLLICDIKLSYSAPEVKHISLEKESNGLYTMNNPGDWGFVYVVDTVAELCFVRPLNGGGHSQIPCSNLKKRPEFKGIIKWD